MEWRFFAMLRMTGFAKASLYVPGKMKYARLYSSGS
jgi:hypothetical protein